MKAGDKINVPFVVEEINEHDGLHIRVKPLEPMHYAEKGGYFMLTRQAQPVEDGGGVPSPAPADVPAPSPAPDAEPKRGRKVAPEVQQ